MILRGTYSYDILTIAGKKDAARPSADTGGLKIAPVELFLGGSAALKAHASEKASLKNSPCEAAPGELAGSQLQPNEPHAIKDTVAKLGTTRAICLRTSTAESCTIEVAAVDIRVIKQRSKDGNAFEARLAESTRQHAAGVELGLVEDAHRDRTPGERARELGEGEVDAGQLSVLEVKVPNLGQLTIETNDQAP